MTQTMGNETTREAVLPQILNETMLRPQGIVLLTGLLNSGLENTINALSGSVGARKSLVVASEGGVFSEGGRTRRILDGDESRTEGRGALAEARVIFADGTFTPARLLNYVSLSEEGRLVVLVQRAPAPLTALRRFLSGEFGEGRKHMLWRLCDQLLLSAGQMRLAALGEEKFVNAHEILLMTPSLRSALETEDFESIEDQLRVGDDSSGTVSFNQSLLQLLLRRRIDIKTAFDATRDPVHLDQILKKVGI